MSYDLLVFDAAHARSRSRDIHEWLKEQTRWPEDHSYDDPAVTSSALRDWFLEIIVEFPAMNGPYRPNSIPKDESAMTDYSIGRNVIGAGFAWSKSESAFQKVFELAAKHGLGLYNLNSPSEEVWLPDREGGLQLISSK